MVCLEDYAPIDTPGGYTYAGANSRPQSRSDLPPLPGPNRPALRLARPQRRVLLLSPPPQERQTHPAARPHRPRNHPHGAAPGRGPRLHLRRPRRRHPPARRKHHRHPPRRPDDLRPPGRPPGPHNCGSGPIALRSWRPALPGNPAGNPAGNLPIRRGLSHPGNHPHRQAGSPLLPALTPLRQLQLRALPRLRTDRAPAPRRATGRHRRSQTRPDRPKPDAGPYTRPDFA